MLVLVLTSCPPSLKGDISKWLFEIHTGVYVGSPSRLVADKLWQRITATVHNGKAVLVLSAATEQGYIIKTHNSMMKAEDFDGIQLMKHIKTEKNNGLHEPSRLQYERKFFPDSFVILNLRTSEADFVEGSLLELGALKVKEGRIIDQFHTVVHSGSSASCGAFQITDSAIHVINKSTEAEALYYFEIFLDHLPVIGCDIHFSLNFLKRAAEETFSTYDFEDAIDLLELSRKHLLGLSNYELKSLAEYFEINYASQDAMEVCKTIRLVLEKIKKIAC